MFLALVFPADILPEIWIESPPHVDLKEYLDQTRHFYRGDRIKTSGFQGLFRPRSLHGLGF